MDTLPPTRNVELMISEVNVTGPCCSCGATDGVLKCSGCKAVSYCGQACQKKGWKTHKKACNTIIKLHQETVAAIDALAICYGGTAALLEAPLVKRGQFNIPSDIVINTNTFASFSFTEEDNYVKARWSLAEAYAKCGQETFSRLAFRLAVENILDMFCLSRHGHAGTMLLLLRIYTQLKTCSWMVAGDMDQLALNFCCYFTRRGQAPRPFPYLDLSIDEDIEGVSCITAVEVFLRSRMQYFPKMWLHTTMMISLIKVKRLQALVSQRRKEDARWNAFMEGTHPGTGASSVVLKLGGVDLVTEKLKEFVVDQSTIKRADLLSKQINPLLEKVNKRNPKLIPGILDRKTLGSYANRVQMVKPEDDKTMSVRYIASMHWYVGKELFSNLQYSERDIYSARDAASMYGHAWHMDREYAGALRLFLDTGNVMAEEKDTDNVMTEEKDTGNVKAGEEDTINVMTEEKDTGNVKAGEEDTNIVKAKREDTGNVKADEDTGNVKAGEEETSIVKAKREDTGNVKAEEKDAGNVVAEEKDTGRMTEEDTGL